MNDDEDIIFIIYQIKLYNFQFLFFFDYTPLLVFFFMPSSLFWARLYLLDVYGTSNPAFLLFLDSLTAPPMPPAFKFEFPFPAAPFFFPLPFLSSVPSSLPRPLYPFPN